MIDDSAKVDDSSKSDQTAHIKVTPKQHEHDHWGIGKLFWGLLLILIGGLVLANNFGMIDVNWSNLWRLWPLFIVAAGVSILSMHHVIWRVLSIIIAFLTLGIVAWALLGIFPDSSAVQTHDSVVQKISDSVSQAEVSLKAGASTIKIGTADQVMVAKASLESNAANLTEQSTFNSGKQQINFGMDTNNNWWMGDTKNSWDISLTRNLPITLDVDAGASQTNIDMSEAQLLAMNVKIGASSLVIRLGDRQNSSTINIESGASSIVMQIPTSCGVQLKLDGGLSSNHLADLANIGDNTYESFGFSSSMKKIIINSKSGLSSFTIERY